MDISAVAVMSDRRAAATVLRACRTPVRVHGVLTTYYGSTHSVRDATYAPTLTRAHRSRPPLTLTTQAHACSTLLTTQATRKATNHTPGMAVEVLNFT
eukprot:scaffold42323_cov270-Isochrysis_galbana.AAC.1